MPSKLFQVIYVTSLTISPNSFREVEQLDLQNLERTVLVNSLHNLHSQGIYLYNNNLRESNIIIRQNGDYLLFKNVLRGDNVNVDNVQTITRIQKMLMLYSVEVARLPSSIITVNIFYNMLEENNNFTIPDNINDMDLTRGYSIARKMNNTTPIDNIFNDENCIYPPIMMKGAFKASNGLLQGIGNNLLEQNPRIINTINQNLHNQYNNVQAKNNNLKAVKRFALLQELLVSRWYNNQLEADDAQNQIPEIVKPANLTNYQGTEITLEQTNTLITAILNFFNDTFFKEKFNLEWVEGDRIGQYNLPQGVEGPQPAPFNEAQNTIASRLRLALRILENPENTNDLITEFINFPQQFVTLMPVIGNAGEDQNNDNPMQDGVEHMGDAAENQNNDNGMHIE
jgi:hypothetical protein